MRTPPITDLPHLSSPPREMARAASEATGIALRAVAGSHATEFVPLEQAAGRTLAGPLTATSDVPHYVSSAMDGFAVSGPGPWTLLPGDPSVHDAAASADVVLSPGTAVAVVTGGVIPTGATTVIRDEYATVHGPKLSLATSAPHSELQGRHLRGRATECRRGDVFLEAGIRLNPAHVALAAVAGIDEIPVVRAPRVALITTGSEVIAAGLPAPGFVRDAFGPVLPHILHGLGASMLPTQRVADDPSALEQLLDQAVNNGADLVVTTGATARSRADHVRSLLERSTQRVVDEIDLQPGHPAMLGVYPGGPAVLALPGNPLAAIVALTVLGVPLISGWFGRHAPKTTRASIGSAIRGSRRERLVPATITAHGLWEACDAVGPNMLRGVAFAHGFLCVPPSGLESGSQTEILPLPW